MKPHSLGPPEEKQFVSRPSAQFHLLNTVWEELESQYTDYLKKAVPPVDPARCFLMDCCTFSQPFRNLLSAQKLVWKFDSRFPIAMDEPGAPASFSLFFFFPEPEI